MGTAQTRANNKYKAKTYDRIEVFVPKGDKEKIQEYAKLNGKSMNSLIAEMLKEIIKKDAQE